MTNLKVAIVGAGAAGLCALRHLTIESAGFAAVSFEQAPRVGGTWYYTDHIGTDEYGLPVHSSMYENLKTNLPKECMSFPDYPFPKSLPSFVRHQDVQEYLEDYAAHFDLLKNIKFLTKVIWIKPVLDNSAKFKARWEVTTQNVINTKQEETGIYDAVLICNGHYAIPMIPDIPGRDGFGGQVIHSHDYRRPSDFAEKTVVMLGAQSSGQDICLELSTEAKKVYLSHNKPPLLAPLPDNVQQKPGISKVTKTQVEFKDGSSVEADVIMFCTGYHYDFSFLAPECGIEVNDARVTPLYKHFVHTKFPNFGIIGVCKTIIPFPMFDIQVRFFKAVLDNTLTLPSEEKMNRDTEEDYRQRLESGLPHRHAHVMGNRQFGYNHQLADMAKTTRIPESCHQVYAITHKMRVTDLKEYKKLNFELNEKGDAYRIKE